MDSANETTIALIPVLLIGAIINWSILFAVYKLSFFNHSFGYLSANQALVDALHSTIFLLYFCPMVLLDQPVMKQYSFIMGYCLLFCYESSVLTHLLISINRLCAAWFPLRYDVWFTIRRTKIMILLLWILNTIIAIIFYQILCHVFYLEDIHFIQFTNTEFCAKVAWYEDFVKNALIIGIIACFDISTVLRVHHITKKVRTRSGQDASKFTARDIRFLKQAVFQGSIFLLELLTYFFIPQYFANKWIIFFGTSFAWVAIHAADGIVVIVCNPEVRKFFWRKKVVQVHSVTETAMTIS
uniref:G_PROTEIN_RECEP_F1_2 domain-containing protein n=2 Tax=Caenorhabditis tropicalis TaxID=1561998 RepID=A0A1I7TXV6_9PELO